MKYVFLNIFLLKNYQNVITNFDNQYYYND